MRPMTPDNFWRFWWHQPPRGLPMAAPTLRRWLARMMTDAMAQGYAPTWKPCARCGGVGAHVGPLVSARPDACPHCRGLGGAWK